MKIGKIKLPAILSNQCATMCVILVSSSYQILRLRVIHTISCVWNIVILLDILYFFVMYFLIFVRLFDNNFNIFNTSSTR